jgi:transcriptional regulator with PAS, ATPase and Fis domain
MVEQGQFRQDLLYRMNTVEITLPPLRERLEDIPLLVYYFLDIYKKKYNKPHLTIGEEAFTSLTRYPWPGNIRELQHSVERAVIMGERNQLVPDDFLLGKYSNRGGLSATTGKIADIEKEAIKKALIKGYKNMDRVAEELGLSRSTLYRKMKKYSL